MLVGVIRGETENKGYADVPDGERRGGERDEALPPVAAEVAGTERELAAASRAISRAIPRSPLRSS